MSEKTQHVTFGRIGILGAIFLIMFSAKIFNYAPDLSWWIVTLPLWGPMLICLGVLFFVFAISMFVNNK